MRLISLNFVSRVRLVFAQGEFQMLPVLWTHCFMEGKGDGTDKVRKLDRKHWQLQI